MPELLHYHLEHRKKVKAAHFVKEDNKIPIQNPNEVRNSEPIINASGFRYSDFNFTRRTRTKNVLKRVLSLSDSYILLSFIKLS